MARVRLDRGQLTRVIQGESRRVINLRAQQVLNRAKVLVPVDTGRLRSSGKIKKTRLFSFRPKATVYFDVAYARIVNDGGRIPPHIIRAKPGGVLRFVIDGRVVYARFVNHPGSTVRARPYLDRALREIVGGRGWSVTNG